MKIAILGMGTIGSGVYELAKDAKGIEVKRTLDIKKWMDDMTTDITDIVNDKEIEAVVETMGGLHPAFEYAIQCLNAGKHYITANKYLVSEYISELKEAAEKNGVSLMFSAACGGGIPYLKNLYEAQKTDKILACGGILNGTTNYILDRMQTEGLEYEEALSEAQALGYAERDPASDVDGLDAARKIILACAVAYGLAPKADEIPTSGIRNIQKIDIDCFKEKGLCARLIASGCIGEDCVNASVEARLFPKDAPECAIHRNVNYAWYEGEKSGRFSFSGQGAGKFPTAANIIRDIFAIIAGNGEMLKDDTRIAKAKADTEKRYYARVPEADANELQKFAHLMKTENGYAFFETQPIAAGDMHRIMKNISGAFFAALE